MTLTTNIQTKHRHDLPHPYLVRYPLGVDGGERSEAGVAAGDHMFLQLHSRLMHTLKHSSPTENLLWSSRDLSACACERVCNKNLACDCGFCLTGFVPVDGVRCRKFLKHGDDWKGKHWLKWFFSPFVTSLGS